MVFRDLYAISAKSVVITGLLKKLGSAPRPCNMQQPQITILYRPSPSIAARPI